MKILLALVIASVALEAMAHPPVHLDLETTSSEYRALLAKNSNKDKFDQPPLALAIKWGDRLAKWLEFENNRRAPSEALRLTSSGTRGGIPIDKPSIYSITTVGENNDLLANELPAELIAVLNGAEFPSVLPGGSDEEFLKIARRIDRNYQTAARLKSLMPWMSHYVRAKKKDVRSYYFFITNGWDEGRFADFAQLPDAEKEIIRGHLIGMCLNYETQTQASCQKRVKQSEDANKLGELFATFSANSAKVWRAFFDIPDYAVRSDVNHKDLNLMIVPFNTPKIAKFGPYLKDNVEAEFKWGEWALKINFGRFSNGPRLKFQPGVVPHVNGLGGNEIVMDSNQPIEEYESQWTIRHEFGHVIGLPDCYHEFYDEGINAFVNYQLDIKDLMCSRAGDMNERIAVELQRVYR